MKLAVQRRLHRIGRRCAALCILGIALNASAQPGSGDMLGAQVSADGSSVTFRVFSAHATQIQLALFKRAYGEEARLTETLSRVGANGLWQLSLPTSRLRSLGFDIDPRNPDKLFTDVFYGYRAWGPNWPVAPGWRPGSSAGFLADVDRQGHRFNPNKLLLDPYALEISHDHLSDQTPTPIVDARLYASGGAAAAGLTPDRQRDTAIFAPKGVVAMPYGAGFASLNHGIRPAGHIKDDIILEAHVRGLSMADGSLGACRGTYAGAVSKIPYLKQLGITAIEFLPTHETENEANDLNDPGTQRSSIGTTGDNYWGYMSTSFFAMDRRYACDKRIGGPTREFAQMVRAFHDAGIKVFTDVVYNHTSEGGTWSPQDSSKASIWSYRGLDNASYYLLTRQPGAATDLQSYYDITGTGNTLNTRHPRVQQLIVDSLLYQRQRLGVDGFRFDLGIALGNSYDNQTNPQDPQRFYFNRNDANTAWARVTASLPGIFMSSEPWGLAPAGQGYQLGQMPAGVSEWNGGYRDVIRRAQNHYGVRDGDATRAAIATRIAGSQDLYGDPGDGRNKPWYAINFLDVHDGFTLKDLYSCKGKNNQQAWPLGPSDGGTTDEDSWDAGGSAALQRQQARTGFALLMLSAGVPIFQAGDETLRSLNCNNNPYNLDSSGNWLRDPSSVEQVQFQSFVKKMIQFRRSQAALRPLDFFSSVDRNGNSMAALDWFGADKQYRTTSSDNSFWQASAAAPDAQGHNRTLAWRYDGSELGGDTVLVLYNAEPDPRTFTLPWTGPRLTTWCRVTDTASWAEGPAQVDLAASQCVGGENTSYSVHGRSLVILLAR
ncbi:MAG: alpha-amylase family glycosyl hydrolase [Paucibacter sp.]|nr:alpha-amylase family glycosyl hydrolase [Roseateles sp.]